MEVKETIKKLVVNAINGFLALFIGLPVVIGWIALLLFAAILFLFVGYSFLTGESGVFDDPLHFEEALILFIIGLVAILIVVSPIIIFSMLDKIEEIIESTRWPIVWRIVLCICVIIFTVIAWSVGVLYLFFSVIPAIISAIIGYIQISILLILILIILIPFAILIGASFDYATTPSTVIELLQAILKKD